jgi:hypothetical protein
MMKSMIIRFLPRKQVHIRRKQFHSGQEVSDKSHLNIYRFLFFFFFFAFSLENELQIAICNQIYFHRNPSEIFGNTIDCSPAHLRTILHSMLPNVQLIDDDLHQSIPINSNKSILV